MPEQSKHIRYLYECKDVFLGYLLALVSLCDAWFNIQDSLVIVVCPLVINTRYLKQQAISLPHIHH